MKAAFNVDSAALDSSTSYERVWSARRTALILAAMLLLAFCWRIDDIRLGTLFQPATAAAMWSLLLGLFPPDFSPDFLRTVLHALVSTVATAVAATIVSLFIAIPLGALATPILWRRGIIVATDGHSIHTRLRASGSRVVYAFVGFLRAIPDLVWALMFVAAVGLGSLAGSLGLAVAYSGVLGRVYADVFAAVDQRPLEALQATGASRLQIFLRGVWPQALPHVTAYTLYSFECCVRAASVLGFVGAGGIGYEISLSMRLFQYPQVMTLILSLVVLLITTDFVSRRIRLRLQPNARHGRRFEKTPENQPRKFAARGLGYLILGATLVACFYLAGFSPEYLGGANVVSSMLRFCRGMFPPDFSPNFVLRLTPLLMQTLAISVLGTLIGIVIGGVLACPATSTLALVQPDTPGARSRTERGLRYAVFWGARLVLNLLRSIPDMVWVLICVLVVGIGSFAGTIAIGLHTAGVLGKLYAEVLEEAPRQPVEALRALGAGPIQVLAFALWPQSKRMLASYTVLRWETNLRVSAILGLVGGGGLGQAIYNYVQLGFYSRLTTLLLVVYGLVMASDWIGDRVSVRAAGV
jgi:phosphonate transport system permease protein